MPIQYPPNAGQILICDYRGFVEPEMVKRRPVIAISPRNRAGYNLVHVVPLSTTEPKEIKFHHIPLTMPPRLIGLKMGEMTIQENCWIKCDLINSVSFKRLDLLPLGRDAAGNRIYSPYCVSKETLFKVRSSVAKTIGCHLDIQ